MRVQARLHGCKQAALLELMSTMPPNDRARGLKRHRQEGREGSSGMEDCFLVKGQTGHRSLRFFFDDKELSDCVVEASDGRSFNCHKAVLAAASPVFRAMFRSSMTEGRSSKVQINGVSPQTVELLLGMVYGKPVTVPVVLALELYMLADQYQLSRTAKKIAHETAAALNLEALCSILPTAHNTLGSTSAYVQLQVRRAAELMLAQWPELPDGHPFGSWNLELIQQVIQPDCPGRAYPRLLAAAKWVQAAYESRQQHWLGELLPLIDFKSFSAGDLSDINSHHPEILQLEGVGSALFEHCWSTLRYISF